MNRLKIFTKHNFGLLFLYLNLNFSVTKTDFFKIEAKVSVMITVELCTSPVPKSWDSKSENVNKIRIQWLANLINPNFINIRVQKIY